MNDPQYPQYPQYPGTTLPVDARREKRRKLNKKILLVAGFVATFLAGIGIGAAAGGSSAADANLAAPAPEMTVTQAVPGPTVTVTGAAPAAKVTAAPKPTPRPSPTFDDQGGDVTAIVGEDIPAGVWTVHNAPSDCYWKISKDGSPDTIINNNIGGGTQRVTLRRGQDFESAGCGVWKKS